MGSILLKYTILTISCFLCFCFFSCKDVEVKSPEASLDKTVLSEHEVEFLNSTLWLPPNYQKLTYEELFEIARVTDDALINLALQSSKEYRNQEKKPVFFRDEFLYGNFIVVYPMSYQRLDKRSASYWISSYDASLKMQDAQYGTTSEIVEKRIKRFGSHQMIKLKVEETRAFNENRNFTQYYISGNTHSFMVIHIDVLSSDYELNFKELSLGSK